MELKKSDCIFCKIAEKTIPATVIFENEKVLAFKDLHPKAKIHYLFIPKSHHDSLAEIPKEKMDLMTHLYSAIQEVSEKEGFAQSGYKTLINTGRGGGQEVFHIHVHLLAN